MANQIIVNQDRRKLNKGFAWQRYTVHMVRPITAMEAVAFGDGMDAAREKWEDAVRSYINTRSHDLGLEIKGIVAHFLEEPNETQMVEVAYWKSRNAVCIWTVWAVLLGPVEEKLVHLLPLPLFGFWPREINADFGVPELFDARVLTKIEQST